MYFRVSIVSEQVEVEQSPSATLLFAEFWFRCFLSFDRWFTLANVRRILDYICRSVFFVSGGRAMVHMALRAQYEFLQQQAGDTKKGMMQGFLSIFSSAQDPVIVLSILQPGMCGLFCA